jgi:DNA-binding CsgD family transcriptional regulator
VAATTEALVGRKAEIELLGASLEAATEGQPRFVLVAGEAGIGKTRLLREAADVAAPLGLRVLSGTAIESGNALPYLPLLPPLAECIDGASDAPADTVRRLVTGQPTSGRFSEAAAALLIESIFAVVAREPTLLLVDDVHWADASTVGVLDYLSHRARSESLAVLIAGRDDEAERLARLPIADGRRFTRVTVGRLGEQEVAQQMEELLGRRPEPELVSAIFERSAGNPFFVEQLLASESTDPSPSLRALVLGRLAELPGRGRQAVEALAVVGRAAGDTTIASIAGIEEDEAADALREATRRGITVPADEGFAFRHPLFPEVVLADLGGSARRRLHRAAARALAAVGAEPEELATHWWEARDNERAWAASLEAAERAERTFAFAEARVHLDRALEAWPDVTKGRRECLLRAANAAWLDGDAAAALALAERGLADGAVADPEAYIALANYAWVFDLRLAAASFERAAAMVSDDTPARTRSLVLWGLSRAHLTRGEYSDARAAGAEAAAIARAADDPYIEARALYAYGMTPAFEGSFVGMADVERGLACALRAASPDPIGHGYQFLASLLHLSGDLDRTLEVALAGVDACDGLGLARTHAADLRGQAAVVLLELGRWDEADAILAAAEPRAVPLIVSALMAMRRGHFERAKLQLESATDVISVVGGLGGGDALWLARAELAWLRGDLAAARSALEDMVGAPGLFGAATAARRARLAVRFAADEPRRDALPVPRVQHPDQLFDAALKCEIAAETARAEGTANPRLWAASTHAWAEARRPYDRTYAGLREAEALFAVGARGPAKEALREAVASASALGARPTRALADDLARRARVSPEPRHRRQADRDEPTPRELDVLRLLAEGLTNREIAARLFLSPKTVGIHISRLHRKLDAHTRGEAVAAARRRGILV